MTDTSDLTPKDVKRVVRSLWDEVPTLMRALLQRTYRTPAGFPSVESLLEHFALGTAAVFNDQPAVGRSDPVAHRAAIAAEQFAACGAPLYCVGADLVHALQQTDPPSDLDLDEGIKMPWPGFALALPFDAPLMSPDGPLRGVLIAEHQVDVPVPGLGPHDLRMVPEPGVTGFLVCCAWNTRVSTPLYSVAVPMRGTMSSVLRFIADDDGTVIGQDGRGGALPLTDPDRVFLDELVRFCVSVVMTFNFTPEFVEGDLGSPTKIRDAKGKVIDRIYPPRWLGRTYVKQTSRVETGSHASPSTHWRRGHWRRVPVGAQRQERRRTWIMPTLVNP
jgi:hypothetical protein